jgi:hypothetical protein
VPDYKEYKPYGYWKDIQNQKEFFDQLAVKYNVQKPEDWNKVTAEMALKEGGNFIIKYYHGSIRKGSDRRCKIVMLGSTEEACARI